MKLSFFLFFLTAPLAPLAFGTLSLDDVFTRTTAQHPRLLAQQARENAAAALVEQAGYRPNPTLNVTLENFGGSGTVRGVDALESTVELTQTIERREKRTARTTLASQERTIAASEAAVLRAELLGHAAQSYVAAAAAARRVALAEDIVALAQRALSDAEARRDAGAASATEPARLRAALASAQADVARQRAALNVACSALAAHWGGDLASATDLPASLSLPETPANSESWFANLEQHPRMVLQQAKLASQRTAVELAQANSKQDFSVAGGVRYLRESSDAALVAGVSIPLPMRHRNQAAIRAARETLTSAEYDAATATRELRAAINAAAQELIAAHTATQHLRRDALPAAEEAAALLRRAYAEGHSPFFEVFEAERARNTVSRELLDQEAAYAAALVRAEALADPSFTATRQLLATP